ncbi:hypothetical protein ACTFIW_002008 [Dictyostelium discoideum]
MEKCIKKTTRF